MLHNFDAVVFRQTGAKKFNIKAADMEEAYRILLISDEDNEMRIGVNITDLGPVDTNEAETD